MASHMDVEHLKNLDEFNKAKEQHNKMVIDFTATWCPPCKRMKPFFKEFDGKFPNIQFFAVDVDENTKTAEDQEISAMPTFKTYYNNAVLNTLTGADKDKLEKLLEELNGKA